MKKFYYSFSVMLIAGSLSINTIGSVHPSFSERNNFYGATPPPAVDETKFVIYVNDGTLFIKYGKTNELINSEAVVYNILGQEITRKKLEAINLNQISIPVQNTCYIIKISYSGKVHTQKVMVSNQ